MTYELQTRRLKLRQWQAQDRTPFARINADPQVMAYYPEPLSELQSNMMMDKITALINEKGWGFWAVETIEDKQFIGFVGLHEPTARLPVSPCVEIGWRLAKTSWGRGYATEGANAALYLAFEHLKIDTIYSFTSLGNKRSKAVMQRIHMHDTFCNFEHPAIPENHPLREHVLYKITHEQWQQTGKKLNPTPTVTSKATI